MITGSGMGKLDSRENKLNSTPYFKMMPMKNYGGEPKLTKAQHEGLHRGYICKRTPTWVCEVLDRISHQRL